MIQINKINIIIKYLFVGVLNNFLNFIVFKVLNFINIQIFYSAAGGFIAGSLLSYFLNSKFTFQTKRRTKLQFIFFLLIQISLLNLFSMIVSFSQLYLFNQENLSWLVATSIVLFFNFTFQKIIFNLPNKYK